MTKIKKAATWVQLPHFQAPPLRVEPHLANISVLERNIVGLKAYARHEGKIEFDKGTFSVAFRDATGG